MSLQTEHIHNLSYVLKQDGVYYVGRIRELPNVFDQGKTRNALERKLKSGVVSYLHVSKKVHKEILKSSKPKIRLAKNQYGKEGKVVGIKKLRVRCR